MSASVKVFRKSVTSWTHCCSMLTIVACSFCPGGFPVSMSCLPFSCTLKRGCRRSTDVWKVALVRSPMEGDTVQLPILTFSQNIKGLKTELLGVGVPVNQWHDGMDDEAGVTTETWLPIVSSSPVKLMLLPLSLNTWNIWSTPILPKILKESNVMESTWTTSCVRIYLKESNVTVSTLKVVFASIVRETI